MKNALFLFLFAFIGLSCEKDDDILLPCEIIATEIQDLIAQEQPDRTLILFTGMFTDGPTSLTFDGCILEDNGKFYNLDQLISHEIEEGKLVLRFP